MIKYLYVLSLILFTFSVCGQNDNDEAKRDLAFYNATNKWFMAWELVSKDIYKIKEVKPVDFIFFDDKNVYSTSEITIEKGDFVRGCNLINLKLQWKKMPHNDSIVLPDKSKIPVGLMCFANGNNKPFFLIPLPSFWKSAGVESKELGLENLITGVFIHEFSHSQQMQNFGRKITEFEKQNEFGVEFSDDIVQNIFDKDTAYLKFYKKEVKLLFLSSEKNALKKALVNKGLGTLKERHEKYFIGKYENLKIIDKFFLTMEGLGQYSMFLWLTNPHGGNIKREIAIEGVRRGGGWWSQDEGFALFLILDKLKSPRNWANEMFGTETKNVIELIDRFIK